MAHPGEGSAHLSEQEWEQLSCGELDAAARERAHAHITSCARCAELHRSLATLAAEAAQFDPLAVSAATARPQAKAWMYLGGLATAAAIFAALFVDLRQPRLSPPAEVTRSERGSLAVVTVAPLPDMPLEGRRFTWQPVASADAYEVEINAVDGAAIWTTRVPGANATVPANIPLPAGRYYWRVTALRENAAMGSSLLMPFRVN